MNEIIVNFTDQWKANGIKALGYGPTGAGKTLFIKTCPRPFIINVATENGLLTLKNQQIPYTTIANIEELEDVMDFLQREENWCKFDTLCVDSLTEVAEVCLAEKKKNNKDGRKAYGDMADEVMEKIRDLISIPGKNLYCICRQKLIQDDTGRFFFSADAPGDKFPQKIPYYFDEVFAFRMMKNSEGVMTRYIQTYQDERYDAKDRSGNLFQFEEPDFSKIIAKI